jgi:hypothetical protein
MVIITTAQDVFGVDGLQDEACVRGAMSCTVSEKKQAAHHENVDL